jgi:hypothetical protein
MSTTHLSSSNSSIVLQARLEKIKHVVGTLIKEYYEQQTHKTGSESALHQQTSFYDMCLNEACVQICLLKPTLLTRSEDLICYGRKVLENCLIVDEANLKPVPKSLSSKRSMTPSETHGKKQRPEPAISTNNSSEMMGLDQSQSFSNNTNNLAIASSLYSALALHLHGQSSDLASYLNKLPLPNMFQSQYSHQKLNFNSIKQLIYLNEQQIQQNLKSQEDLKAKLFILNTTNASPNLIEQIQFQLNDLIKKHGDMINEQIKLKGQELMLGEEHQKQPVRQKKMLTNHVQQDEYTTDDNEEEQGDDDNQETNQDEDDIEDNVENDDQEVEDS